MTKEVFLHAGMHKTGTTSIQDYLSKNRKELARRGYAVMGDLAAKPSWWSGRFSRSTNCFRIAHLAIDPALQTPMRLRGIAKAMSVAERDAAIADVTRAIHKCAAPRIIISSEAFSFLRSDDEHALLRRMLGDHNIRPILFFRNKTDWLKSWRSEMAKHMEAADSPRTTTAPCRLPDEAWLLDHAAVRRFWGPEANVLSYDETVAEHGSVIPAFLEALGLAPENCPVWDKRWLNRSPTTPAADRPTIVPT